MPELIPLPAHAASFWVAGDELWIAFPGQGPEERGHSVHLPATTAGLQRALDILRERAHAKQLTCGTKASPVQYDLLRDRAYGKMLKSIAADKAAAAEAKAKAEADKRESRLAKFLASEAARELALAELEELGL